MGGSGSESIKEGTGENQDSENEEGEEEDQLIGIGEDLKVGHEKQVNDRYF